MASTARRALAFGLMLWLIAMHDAPAQQFTFRQYGQEDGLANLALTCLFQDRAGFTWMCTENGLFRYDGTDFERFGEDEGVKSTVIRGAVEDSSGRLWVGTASDLYQGDGGHFRAIRPEGHNLIIAPGLRIAALSAERVLVINKDQLLELHLSPADGVWHSAPYFTAEQLAAPPGLQHLSSIGVDRFGRIWLGCDTQICAVQHGRVDSWGTQAGVPEDTWRSWLVDRDGRLWARGQSHVVVLEAGATRFETRDPPHSKLTADILNVPLVADHENRIIARNDVGLARWDQGRWEEFTTKNGLPPVGVAALLVSRDGTLWLGTAGHGLSRWLGYGNFESWTVAQGLDADPVWSVLRSASRGIVMGTRAGCYRIDETSRRAVPCRFDGLPAGEIQLMTERADGSLWIGMTTGELLRIAAGEQRATLVANLPLMRKLYADTMGRLWICTNTAVYVVQPGAARVQQMTLPAPVGEITDAAEDSQGAIWMAAQGGLLRWSGGEWTVLKVDSEHARDGFGSVTAVGGGWLWVGTTSQGVLHLHVEGDRADHVERVAEPMVARASIYFTQKDARGWIWVGTDAGVAVFDGHLWRRFSRSDGLIWNDTDQNSVFVDTDGSVWIGTSGGLAHVLQPERLMQSAPLDLRIIHATLGGRMLDAQTPHQLPWQPNAALNLHLADLQQGEARQTVFRVRLRGLSEEWFETPDPKLHYPGLAPGEYTFEAVSVDSDHQRTSQLTRLSFEIWPPWWGTVWFRLVVVAVACAVLAAAWNYRMHNLSVHKRELERQLEERQVLLERATRDALTGLWNRTAILEILAREIESARQFSTSLAIVLIDVDHFKRINDTYGHLCGDAVLRVLSTQVTARVRVTDSLGRYGGEEFLLVVPGAPQQRPFLPLERLRRSIAEIPFSHDGLLINVTASFGMAWLSHASDTAEKLLGRADTALYSAKYAGRNRIEYAEVG
jgi:diguanylate cyclase (GGDEF)-like protein